MSATTRFMVHDYKIVEVLETDDDGMVHIKVLRALWTYEPLIHRLDYWVVAWQLFPLNQAELARMALDKILEEGA